jgi:hypothetical protein
MLTKGQERIVVEIANVAARRALDEVQRQAGYFHPQIYKEAVGMADQESRHQLRLHRITARPVRKKTKRAR